MIPRAPRGFTLIELMVAVTILGLLIVLGVPSYQQWIANTRIRNAQESIQNGLREARIEAVKRNANVRFELLSATTADWQVCVPAPATPLTCGGGSVSTACSDPAASPPCFVEQFNSAGGSSNVVLGASNALGAFGTPLVGGVPGGITFGPLGQILDYGNTAIIRIDANTTQTGNRRLVTTITPNGSVKMCDPAPALSTYPQGCS